VPSAALAAKAKRCEPDLPALHENEQSALDYIRECGPVSAKQIAEHVCGEEQTVRTWMVKSGRLYAAGVRHKRSLGGYCLADVADRARLCLRPGGTGQRTGVCREKIAARGVGGENREKVRGAPTDRPCRGFLDEFQTC